MQNQVVGDMRKQGYYFETTAPFYASTNEGSVEQEIADQIDVLVKEQVAECLKAHIPKELQLEVASSKRELEELNNALHNS